MDIRRITQEQDAQQYLNLCKYCFPNSNNWIDHMLPLPEHDLVFGGFRAGALQAATVSKSFSASLFGQNVGMNGIGAVVSAPEGRNSGCVREVLAHVLRHERERGMLVSALYPFLFRFYEKMGYGYIGGMAAYTFKPEDISAFTISGACIPVASSDHVEAMIRVHNQFVRQYDFGIDFTDDIAKYLERLTPSGPYAYIYRNSGGETRGYLEYRLIEIGSFSKNMQIERFGYLDAEAFQALLAFIRSHRGQCAEVTMPVPDNVPLRHIFQEPRVKVEPHANWMGRPLDVEAVLRLRLAFEPCEREIAFSVEDPILDQNTGTYTLQGTTVMKSAHSGRQAVPFAVFSSLLFHAMTFEQAYYAGKIGWHDEAAAHYFSRKGAIYVSAEF